MIKFALKGGDPSAASSALVAVVGDSRLKHGTSIHSVAFSPDDAWLAAGDAAGLVKIWNATTGEEVRSIRAHGNAVIGVAFSPDGRRLAFGNGNAVTIHDLDAGRDALTLEPVMHY